MVFIMVPAHGTGNPQGAGAGCLDNKPPSENVPGEGLLVDSELMLTFDEALARVLQEAPRLGHEIVAIADANGRVLAESVRAEFPLPPHDYSAMDGYALHIGSLTGDPPWNLPVRGESRTGRVASRLEPGTACRIFTGAEIPDGANAVVMQESVERDGEGARFQTLPRAGDHIRRAGEDVEAGKIVLGTGTRLGPYQLGLLAAVDRGHVTVAKRPRVTIVSTGDELRPPGSSRRPGTIPESNGVAIAALASSAGAVAELREPARDDAVETARKFADALAESDVLVTIGGVSVGDYDVVRPALEAAGVRLDFYKVAIKPGKPLTLGRLGDTLVLGLPGNPVSAQVTFSLFGLPLLRRMQGDERGPPTTRRLRLGAPIAQKTGRLGFYAATVAGDVATPLSGQASGSTTSLAWADALVVVPADSTGYGADEVVDVISLGDL
ncbi:MAG TPA: gephyrin-like molybdotransferase Glp [Polyangiaceae bacterium]